MGKLDIDAVHLPQIHKRLYLASLDGARQLGGKDVATICVAGRETCSYMKKHPSKYRAYIIAADTTFMDLRTFKRVFNHAAELIRDQLNQGRYVIVHCYAGINRSVTSILRYIQLFTNKDWREARDYIRTRNETKRHTLALNNQTFEHFLYELDSRIG